MKTNGQILYEYKHPTRIPVVHVNNRHFANAGDVMYMPVHQAPWNLLTEACRLTLSCQPVIVKSVLVICVSNRCNFPLWENITT
jgi:hypothetical protein